MFAVVYGALSFGSSLLVASSWIAVGGRECAVVSMAMECVVRGEAAEGPKLDDWPTNHIEANCNDPATHKKWT